MCLHFSPKRLDKQSVNICSSLTWRHGKKCKIFVTSGTFKMNIPLQLPLRSSHSRLFSKNICPQKQPSRSIYQCRCSELVVNFFENTCDRVQFLVNFHVTLPALDNWCWRAIFYHVILLNNYFCGAPLAVASVFWKAGENSRETSGIIRQISSSSL